MRSRTFSTRRQSNNFGQGMQRLKSKWSESIYDPEKRILMQVCTANKSTITLSRKMLSDKLIMALINIWEILILI